MQNLTGKYLNQLLGFIFTFVLLLIFSVIFAENSNAQINRWTYIGTTAEGIVFYIDQTSVERSGREVRLWGKSIFPDGSYQINLSRWDCSDRTTMVIISNIYSPQGKVVGRKKGNGWDRVIPESVGEALYAAACNFEPKKTTAGKVVPENIKVISKQANIRELPSMNAAIVKKAVKGTVFRLVEAEPENGWYQIYTGSGETAWIHGNTVEFIISVPKNNSKKVTLPPSILNDPEDGQN
jgi:hypothetical protein